MTTDNDQDAVEALLRVRCKPTSKAYSHGDLAVPYREGAEAILDAIRKGEVPGVWYNQQIATERDALRAEVERLKKELDDEMGKAGEWIDIRTHRERVSAAVARISDHARKMEAERDAEKARADKAEAHSTNAKLCYEAEIEKEQESAAHWKREYDGAMSANARLAHESDSRKAERDRLAGLLVEAVSVIKAIRDDNSGQRWSHTLELRMLSAFDSVKHAQLLVGKGAALAEVGKQ